MNENSLADQLRELRDGSNARARELYDELARHLKESGALGGALKQGATFPDFELPDAQGRLVTRADILSDGPAVVVFDRGAWCPYCRTVLAALGKVASQIRAAGARLVAVTPEVSGGTARIKQETGIDFDVLCDVDSVLAMQCGLVFPVSDDLRKAYLERGIDLEKIYGNNAWMLPAPATFVVGRDAKISRVFLDPDFRYRLEPSELLAHLTQLL